MLIEIPDDLARKAKPMITGDADTHRRWAEIWEQGGKYHRAVFCLVDAALVDADLPELIRVGHLARSEADDTTFLVLALGRERAFLEAEDGWETARSFDVLTYAGPKPEGWGQ